MLNFSMILQYMSSLVKIYLIHTTLLQSSVAG